MSTAPVPSFYLYGEPQRSVAEGFVHVESLDDRSRPSEWTIRPHVHRDLNHIILIARGGGAMQAEAAKFVFDAPCLLLIPAGIVHGFTWHSESSGHVITIADSYLRHLIARDADLAPLFVHPHAVALPPGEGSGAEAIIARMAQELDWASPGQRAAVESALLALMVLALRHATLVQTSQSGTARQAALVARLRERIEQRFRQREPVADHAQALGASLTALRQACAHVAGSSPAQMLDDRALLEARRLLLYSQLSVTEIAYAVGFEDPAYFSRFFTRHVGQPPRAYRAAREG
ncbi:MULTISPECIES: helix-turn-helix domain-containing protein [Sphingobium]|jgi:AraC family transcriptional activator of pobA|uniref:Helix-turn-helix domain-containing protein n=1 Tax=Sphingobium limneticum TaxID=1007511 RepID=A0A5J5HW76_9SPHN|nr:MULTISPECIES: helix-turn-helix domain-containing protein [Sphingobium]MBU0931771.1 helix-turn-helix domain-containing protein [Alphaproteobacteria bacterium]KAA9013943.1 helix-turn-helix domain-containing protein [Sphingobium limneticum]KAA9014450.1 helix-turn-helix domain-containing protein [Sphingobium limneticum]KAA9027099.1 helix-turn-helix domain-containing protein [Sphingobium limneticum]BBD03442.1 AraC family transcriptional regulator, transcriptional activator of pobA [Sphingobium s